MNTHRVELVRSLFAQVLLQQRYQGSTEVVAGFGRYCSYLAQAVAAVVVQTGATHFALSGNVGKDSGPLPRFNITEADFLLSAADAISGGRLMQGGPEIGLDYKATNGVENAKKMVEILQGWGFGEGEHGFIAAVAHSTAALRLGLCLKAELVRAGVRFAEVVYFPSSYIPDPERLLDQWEILFEIKRISELFNEGYLDALPAGLTAGLIGVALAAFDEVVAELAAQGISKPSTAGLPSFAA